MFGCMEQDPQIKVSASSYYFVDTLPSLFFESEMGVDGEIYWIEDQALKNGVSLYSWTFMPNDIEKYRAVSGTMELKKVDKLFRDQTLDQPTQTWEEGKSYAYVNCIFSSPITQTLPKPVDVEFANCEFLNQVAGSSNLNLSSINSLIIDGCKFNYTPSEKDMIFNNIIDLDLYNCKTSNITITNNSFSTKNSSPVYAISLKTKQISANTPMLLSETNFSGEICGNVLISNNEFLNNTNNINLGENLGETTTNNLKKFNVKIKNNYENLNIYENYENQCEKQEYKVVEKNKTKQFKVN